MHTIFSLGVSVSPVGVESECIDSSKEAWVGMIYIHTSNLTIRPFAFQTTPPYKYSHS